MSSARADDDDDGYAGLPDAAFTEDELAAGVQHIMRTGDPDATSSGLEIWREERLDSGEDEVAAAPLRFETFEQARSWALANPGQAFTRASDGRCFEVKVARKDSSINHEQRRIDSFSRRSNELREMVPHLHDVIHKSASNRYSVKMHPFYRNTWQNELNRLPAPRLERLRSVLATHLEASRENLRRLYAEMRRFRSMKAGDYGEELSERVNQIMQEALEDIDKRRASINGSKQGASF